MKKNDLILIGVVLLIGLIALFSDKGTKIYDDVEYPLTLTGTAGLHQITYDDYKSYVSSNEPFIVILERTGCTYCIQYMPIVEEVANEKSIPIYYIDTDTLTNEEFNELSSTNNYLKRNEWGTPTTLFMLGDRVLDTIGGLVEKEEILSFLDGKVIMGE